MRRLVQVVMIALLGLVMAGCAEFPKNGAGQYTKLTFTVNLNGQLSITQPYIYGIVINLAQGSAQPPVNTVNAIAPVFQQGSINGMYTGLATNALLILSLANTAIPVSVYNYGTTGTETGGSPLPPNTGYTIDQLQTDQNGNITGPLTFTVFLNQLQSTNAQSYQWIQFQVLTMNKTTLAGSSGRYFDALGVSPAFTVSNWLPLNSSTTFNLTQISNSGVTGNTTPSGGDPALSIQNVTLNVQTP